MDPVINIHFEIPIPNAVRNAYDALSYIGIGTALAGITTMLIPDAPSVLVTAAHWATQAGAALSSIVSLGNSMGAIVNTMTYVEAFSNNDNTEELGRVLLPNVVNATGNMLVAALNAYLSFRL
jgi:hypothetical protein